MPHPLPDLPHRSQLHVFRGIVVRIAAIAVQRREIALTAQVIRLLVGRLQDFFSGKTLHVVCSARAVQRWSSARRGAARCVPRTFFLNCSGSRSNSDAASPFNGSVGFGYASNCGRNDSKTFVRSAHRGRAAREAARRQRRGLPMSPGRRPRRAPNIGLHVWLMTSKHTDPELRAVGQWRACVSQHQHRAHARRTARRIAAQLFVDVRMEDFVHEADGRRLVRIRLVDVDVHLPDAVRVRRCVARKQGRVLSAGGGPTVARCGRPAHATHCRAGRGT